MPRTEKRPRPVDAVPAGGMSRRAFARGAALLAVEAAALVGAGVAAGGPAREAYADAGYDQATVTREGSGTRALTPYYSILVPDALSPEGFSYSYDPQMYDLAQGGGEALLHGRRLTVILPNGESFFLMCHSPNWSGLQGTFVSQDIGYSSGDSSTVMLIGAGFDGIDASRAEALVQAYAPYVSCSATSTAPVVDNSLADDPYAYLAQLHGRLGSYNAQIVGMATTFNNDFLDDDLSIGRGQLAENATLQATLRSEYRTLLTLQIPPTSPHYRSSVELLVLINDLQERLVPIYQAWQNRMLFPFTAGQNRDRIVAPLAQDLYPSGLSIFKADFDERYERAHPNW